MTIRNWLRVTILLVLAIALPVQASAAAIMSVGALSAPMHSGSLHAEPTMERVIVKRDCHGQIVQTEIFVPVQAGAMATQSGDDVANDACPHCSVGCSMAGLTISILNTRENTPSFGKFSPSEISFLSFIGRVPELPPKG